MLDEYFLILSNVSVSSQIMSNTLANYKLFQEIIQRVLLDAINYSCILPRLEREHIWNKFMMHKQYIM